MTVPIFINDRCLTVSPDLSIRAVLLAADPAWIDALDLGKANLTDGRGIALDPEQPARAGAIIRIALSARRADESPDAHP